MDSNMNINNDEPKIPNFIKKSVSTYEVEQEPIEYKKSKSRRNIEIRTIAIAIATCLAIGGIAIGIHYFSTKADKETNMFVSNYIGQNYEDIAIPHRTDGNKYVFYDTIDIANKILKSSDLEEAIYAAWYEIDHNKEDVMDETLRIVNYKMPEKEKEEYPELNLGFNGYVKSLGYVDEEGKADVEAYSEGMKEKIAMKKGTYNEENSRGNVL